MAMLDWIIQTFYKAELNEIQDRYTEEAKSILDDAKKYSNDVKNKTYIPYERININSNEFLYGMQPIFNNKYFVSWLNEQKLQWQRLIKKSVDEGDKESAHLFSVKMSLIDDLFFELRDFEYKYNEMLNQKKEEQLGRTKQ